MKPWVYISRQYTSNCFLEALKAKFNNWQVKIYFCKPRITKNGNVQMFHCMWSDGKADYDFSDMENTELPWYKCFWFRGKIRQFPAGFAKKYSNYRNGKIE